MMRRKFSSAYMTLEASFVLPFILFVGVMMFYLAVYVYDYVLLSQDVYVIARKAAISLCNNYEAVTEQIEKDSCELQNRPYISTENIYLDMYLKSHSVTLIASTNLRTPINGFFRMVAPNFQSSISVRQTVITYDIQQIMRMTEQITKQKKDTDSDENKD